MLRISPPSVTTHLYFFAGVFGVLLCACSDQATGTAAQDDEVRTGGTASGGSTQGPLEEPAATGGAATGGQGPDGGGTPATGGSVGTGGTVATGGTIGTGGSVTTGGTLATGGTQGTGGAVPDELLECDAAGLEWRSGKKTNYTSYPDPGSEECIKYNGCMWAGFFAGCDEKQPEDWVESHNLVAVFPDFAGLAHHRLCLRSGDQRIVVHVVDTCGDTDCGGCCTRNKGTADKLIDLESYTNERWGVEDGRIEWADLGPATPICQ